ncbi:TetR/AcrR family transcriptional regulator [Corynebacterium aquatimens]|uniref:AcrR family transcriptional regulator n=1 Tax=Corynebacterium aquatimens TaxID=1190508 RepID=A0A931E0U2_9CORY|nr:TetR/AcrR family transcriptional regulator [Corynebacterium aquatimens]MBG6122629.1 AcrR family transcriptional regulator [Corynebacterium aquatimens]WJY64831.1 HTH-type transcriptional regulator BetI [Corynebacterium aquatimens]
MASRTRTRLTVEQRRAEILDTAASIFDAAPFNEISTTQIATQCGISQGLIFHYFESKAGLYAAVLEQRFAHLRASIAQCTEGLPPNTPARETLKAAVGVYLDYIAQRPAAWVAETRGNDIPAEALFVRIDQRDRSVSQLRELLSGAMGHPRAEFAVTGFFGFVDAICVDWADAGCPVDKRHALIETALGALEGALGDWG